MAPSSVLPTPERGKPGSVFRAQDPPKHGVGAREAPRSPPANPFSNLSQPLANGARAQLATASPSTAANPGSASGWSAFSLASLETVSSAPLVGWGSPAPESPASSLFTTPSRSPWASPSPEPQRSSTQGRSVFSGGAGRTPNSLIFASSSPGTGESRDTGTMETSPFAGGASNHSPFVSQSSGSATRDSSFKFGTSTNNTRAFTRPSFASGVAANSATSQAFSFGSPSTKPVNVDDKIGTATGSSPFSPSSTPATPPQKPQDTPQGKPFGSASIMNAGSEGFDMWPETKPQSAAEHIIDRRPKARPYSRRPSSTGNPSPTPSSTSSSQPSQNALEPGLSLDGRLRTLNLGLEDPNPVPPAQQTPIQYNISEEQPPRHEFFTFAVQKALTAGREVAVKINHALDKVATLPLADADSDKLCDDALKLSRWKATGSCKIAVLGDSGQGKSSLINSLLHVPGIAQTSDMGSACTSVVTEYHQKQSHQTSPIAIEVEYLRGGALEELVKELAWSYRQFYMPDVQSSSGMTTDEDYAKYQRESDQAWFALESAFQHHQGFSAEFLRDQSEGAQDRVTERLAQWAREIKWPAGHSTSHLGASVWRSIAEDAEECCEKTKIFMQDGLWPFTKIIRVYLSSQVLNGGVILADLPGLQDTNLARVKITQDYLLKCDNILIVSKITRAITDHSLKSSLFSVVARHVPTEWEETGGKKLNLAVVCTGTEEIDSKKAIAEFCGEGKRISKEAMTRLEADIQAAKTSGDPKKKKAAKRKLEFALIGARNAHVKEALQKRYSKDTGGDLEVFCIANKAYEKFARKGNTDIVKASGIPDLRRFCHSIIADTQMHEARHFLGSLLPGLLNSVDLWASSHTSHGAFDETDKSNMEKHLANIQEEAPKYVEKLREAFLECFQEQITGFLGHREDVWKRAAENEAREWDRWRWNTYKAWCKNNGNHSTANREHTDWNAKIIWKMRMELEFQWDIVEEEIPEVFQKLSDDISRELTWLKEYSIMQASETDQRALLIQAIDNLDQAWKYNISLRQQELSRGVSHIRKQASESNETSFVFREMLATYRLAASQCGPGTDVRQKDIVNRQISGETLFPNMAVSMSRGIEKRAAETERTVGALVRSVMDTLKQHVRLALREGRNTGVPNRSVTELKNAVDKQRNRLGEVSKI